MQTDLFNYELPPELIAQRPPANRQDARLLALDGASGELIDYSISDVVRLIQPGDLLVFNNTQVIKARLFGTKQSGGKLEFLVERILEGDEMIAHIKASKAPRVGSLVSIAGRYSFQVTARENNLFRLVNASGVPLSDIMEGEGHVPLPPYIDRADEAIDVERYQTVYGSVPGAVAAPTAGLHFDQALIDRLERMGTEIGFITLHVGAGTFLPVRSDTLEAHTMHSERYVVSPQLVRQVAQAQARGNRVVAIGTTSVRALEAAAAGGALTVSAGETDIFIHPGYRFRVVDGLLTNFHLPESTLLMLVCAFAGRDRIMRAYSHAIRERYRFFSYGDAMWITPQVQHRR